MTQDGPIYFKWRLKCSSSVHRYILVKVKGQNHGHNHRHIKTHMRGVAPKNTTPGPPADCNQGSVFIILHVYQIVKIQIQQPQPVSKEIYRAITCRIVIAGKRLVAVCSSLRLRPRRVLSDRESVTLKRCVQRVNDLPSLQHIRWLSRRQL